MTTIAILRDGTPVRIHLFDNPIFDVDGFLVRFTFPGTTPEVYKYRQHSEFKTEDKKKPNLAGYYNEAIFLKYIQNIEPVPTMDLLVKYNFKNVLATEGEEIIVSTVDLEAPYEYFYNYKKYTFNLQSTLDKKGVRNYLKPIIEDLKVVDSKINTDGINGIITLNNQSNTPGGYFYKKNFGDFVNTWTTSNIQKSNLKKIMSLIIFKIREINRDIIPIIAANTHFFDKEVDVANGIIDYNDPTNGFTDLEGLLFDLKKNWGYYYAPLDPTAFPLRENFDALFSSLSTYNDYLVYYSSLLNFYNKCYRTKDLGYYPSDKKLQYLLEILSPSALGILPYALIIKTIKRYLTIKLSEEDQRVLVRLVMSITPSHANDFLGFLLEKENGAQTNFETIYESLTDARLERYTIVNWFVDEQPNRKYFAFAIFELWKVSKYNLGYIPPGVTPINQSSKFAGVDPNGYFVINRSEFNNNNFLTFSSSTSSLTTKEQFFTSTLSDKKINIDKISKEVIILDHGAYSQEGVVSLGSFHLYQQVSFSGFEANLDLRIPKTSTVPAFLFHFIEEFDRLADFDAAVSLAIELTANVLLVYFTGGASILRDLEYLKYTTQIGKAFTGGIEATQAVEIWRGLEVGSEIFTLTAGSLAQISGYLITTENNADKKKIFEGYQRVLIALTLLGAGASVVARAHAVREAEKVLTLIETLPVNVPHGLSLDAMNLLRTLKGDKDITLTTFGNRLNNLDLGGATNTIVSKYNTLFTDAQKLKFWNDFQHIDDPAFWKLLNSGKNTSNVLDGSYMVNWLNLSERGLAEAKFTEYICKQTRTNNIIRFVDESSIKPVLGTLSYERKLAFLDTFGDVDPTNFAKFVDEPQLINYWKRYYDDGVLRGDFLILNKTKQLEFLDAFGNINNYWFNRFKKQPYLFDRFNTATTSSKLLANTNPKLWIRINRYYVRPNNGLGEKLSSTYLRNTYNTSYAETLVNAVETKSQELFNLFPSRGYRDHNFQLVSGMIDKETGEMSELFTNFHYKHFETDGLYEAYRATLHPNINGLIEELENVKSLYNIDNALSIERAGHYIGTHAEIRALDDLIKKRFGNGLIDENVFNDWLENSILGYNRNIQVKPNTTKVIMPRCADCFYITDLLTFIK